MITLDTTSIDGDTDEIYSVERNSKIAVFLNGNELKKCVYCNVTKGLAICAKQYLGGGVVIAEGCIVYELVFGAFIIKHIHEEDQLKRSEIPLPEKPKK